MWSKNKYQSYDVSKPTVQSIRVLPDKHFTPCTLFVTAELGRVRPSSFLLLLLLETLFNMLVSVLPVI